MVRMSIHSLQPGMIVGKSVIDSQGNVLINYDVELTDRFINGLKQRNIAGIYIKDGLTDDILPDENISDVVRSSTIKRMRSIFNTVEGINKDMKNESLNKMKNIISSDHYQETINKNPEINNLLKTVKNIVSDLINRPTIVLGMNSLKTFSDYLFQHATEVSITAVMIGRKIGLPPKRLQELGAGCLLMDIGNVFIPKDIVNKPGKLTKDELLKIKEHPVIGYEILKGVHSLGVLPPHVAFQHHEKQNGKGYPRGLRGNNTTLINDEPNMIHLYASIAAVADVYDALCSETPYRKAFPRENVITMMTKHSGTHFNKEVLKAFLSVTPIYPEGSTVKVSFGKFHNKVGVVTSVNRKDLSRPNIRLFMDLKKKKLIKPVELDLLEEKTIKIESILL